MSYNIYSKIVEALTEANMDVNLSFVGKIQELLERGTSLEFILNNLEILV